MAALIPTRVRFKLYVRLVIGAALIGIAFGYYLQVQGRLEMTPFLVFAFAIRGLIVGALIWAFELFVVMGRYGQRFARLSRGTRFAIRIVAYVVLFETGFALGSLVFATPEFTDLFFTAAGKK